MPFIGTKDYSVDWSTHAALIAFEHISAPSSFTATKMFCRAKGITAGEKIVLAIYSDSGGSPSTKLGQTGEITMPTSHDGQWFVGNLQSSVSIVSGNKYWLAIWGDNNPATYRLAGTYNYSLDQNFTPYNPTFPSTWTETYTNNISKAILVAASADELVPVWTRVDLLRQGRPVTASDGTKLIVMVSTEGLDVFRKQASGEMWIRDARHSATVIFGAAIPVANISVGIDSNDVLHILACTSGNYGNRDVAYNTLSPSAGAWTSWGTWEAVLADYGEGPPNYPGCGLSLDSNDYPHVVYVDLIKQAGDTGDNVYYTERTGGSWAARTQIGTRATKSDHYDSPRITLRNSNYIEAFYYKRDGGADPAYKSYIGSWGTEGTYSTTSAVIAFGGVVSTTSGTVYRYYIDQTGNIRENGVDTGFDTYAYTSFVSPALDSSGNRYIFYINPSGNLYYIYNNGGGWTAGATLAAAVSVFEYASAEWQYNNYNQSGLNVIAEEATNAYFTTLDIAGTDNLTAVSISTTPVTGTPAIGQTHALSAVGISTTPITGTPAISQIQPLTADSISTTPVVGTPTAGQSHTLDAVSISTTPVTGTPAIGQTHAMSAVGISTTPITGTPAIAQTHALSAVGISTTPVVGTPTAGQSHILDAVSISTTPVTGIPAIGQTHALSAVGISTTPVTGTPAIGQTHILTAVSISTTPVLGIPTTGQSHILTADSISTTPVTGTPIANRIANLTAVSISTTPVTGIPAIGQTHVLSSVGISTTPVTDTPTLTEEIVYDLTAVGISTTPVLQTPSIGQTHALVSVGIITTPVLGTPTLSTLGTDNLDAVSISTTPVTGTPSIGQTHVLTSVGISTVPETGTPTVTSVIPLVAVSISTTPAVGTPAIGQTHALSATGIAVTPETGTPVLSHIHDLNAISISTIPVTGIPVIGQSHVLDATSILVSPLIGVPLLGQTHTLSAVGITTTPIIGVPSWKLAGEIVWMEFAAWQPEVEFRSWQPEIEFEVITED